MLDNFFLHLRGFILTLLSGNQYVSAIILILSYDQQNDIFIGNFQNHLCVSNCC